MSSSPHGDAGPGSGEVDAAAVALLVRGIHDGLAEAERRAGAVAEAFERYASIGLPAAEPCAAVRVLDGFERIDAAIARASALCSTEMLTVQPNGIRSPSILAHASTRDPALVARGARMRTLYTHVARYGHALNAYLERLGDGAEVRTLDEVPDRMMIFDRAVAFLPANPERTSALELRQPALVGHLVTVFESLWSRAVPLADPVPAATGISGITHRERVIAALLAEGHQDAVVAQRLGISVRTCRHHIGRLAEALGSSSRAQLGVRIARAGLGGPPHPGAPR
ncbi:LuxR C-terminal-related transcriptional regulator [Streptomyces sp. NPDC001691]|uniref:helix-turn-helix transcriptional regulator n=1 Tax=unclassified Streptomyces TaxID=2593676 RepID=UPI000DE96206|nr:helix-turn-helix transcriptional regulator [Streptomyces sp. SDr-06]RCH64411.1 LuxR family transcriptional regulator [Streptomyces sp. SDr-06]